MRITLPSSPNRVITGEVENVSPIVDRESHAVPVRVRIDNVDGALRLNSFAHAQFKLTPPAGSTTIAGSALRSNGDRSYV
ncbi:MAG: efflux RND transporter periplasmic adaptor subunit [Polyangiaceae bacterium]